MPDSRGVACAVTTGERATRAVLAAVAGTVAYAAGTSGWLWCAVPAAACATLLALGAVTGWCPTSLLRRREPATIGTDHGYPDARGVLRLTTRSPHEGSHT